MQKALNLLAKIHLLTNDWGNAIGAAELVLEVDKQNTKAINVKAEALFNVCQFERALVLFYRGMVSTPKKYATESSITFLFVFSIHVYQMNIKKMISV